MMYNRDSLATTSLKYQEILNNEKWNKKHITLKWSEWTSPHLLDSMI